VRLGKASLAGLYAALEMAADPARHVSAGEIAEAYGISSHHLAKVMRTLVRAGLATSVLGPGGGYRFAGNPRRTTLLDIIALFEDVDEAPALAADPATTSPFATALAEVGEEIDASSAATLGSITLAALLRNAGCNP
jgi:Rrf2 family protein